MSPVLAVVALAATAWGQTGVQVNVDQFGTNITGDAANEPTIAVDPLDPNILVIGWRQFDTIASNKRFAGYAYSQDGGETWINAGPLGTPPNQPPGSGQSDPVLAYDADGNFYYWSEVFEPVPPTAHYVYRSVDGGVSWLLPAQVQDPAVAGDKPWLVIDRTGGLGHGNFYGGWTNLDGSSYTLFVRSIDSGLTFSAPLRLADYTGQQFMLHFAIGPDGELYAAWRNYPRNAVYITKSINARDPNATPTFDVFGTGGVNGLDILLDNGNDPGFLPINPVGFHQIWLGVDHTDGPRRGWVYCVWADNRYDICDIIFARSTDGGFTWETDIRINDDPVGNGVYQWMVAMDVAPSGRIDVSWYDTRDHTGNTRSSLYYSNSIDGGDTWSANRRLSADFDTTLGYPQQDKIGDYTQMIAHNEMVDIAYAATHNGEQDIWFMRIEPFLRGDVNCDGLVDFGDINPFVNAMLCVGEPDPQACWIAQYPGCPFSNADVNEDAGVTFGDINPFVALLID